VSIADGLLWVLKNRKCRIDEVTKEAIIGDMIKRTIYKESDVYFNRYIKTIGA
jgi:hypothetical protein